MNWRIHHKEETVSTNLDAREGRHGDVFTADFQSAGRGRLDHVWLSPPKTNLMMSAVLSVDGLSPEQVATLPLVAGLAVVKAVARLSVGNRDSRHKPDDVALKWPNDVLVDGKKIAGILCARNGDKVIVGIGVNVGQTEFPSEIADRATSLFLLNAKTRIPRARTSCAAGAGEVRHGVTVEVVRDGVLTELQGLYDIWREKGFAAVYPEIAAHDCLKGRLLSVRQTDDDESPVSGVCGGVRADGSLDVGGVKVYAGEAHVLAAAGKKTDILIYYT